MLLIFSLLISRWDNKGKTRWQFSARSLLLPLSRDGWRDQSAPGWRTGSAFQRRCGI
jgi:hypothetical protein